MFKHGESTDLKRGLLFSLLHLKLLQPTAFPLWNPRATTGCSVMRMCWSTESRHVGHSREESGGALVVGARFARSLRPRVASHWDWAPIAPCDRNPSENSVKVGRVGAKTRGQCPRISSGLWGVRSLIYREFSSIWG